MNYLLILLTYYYYINLFYTIKYYYTVYFDYLKDLTRKIIFHHDYNLEI